MAKTAGMDCTLKARATAGLSSTLTLASSTAPPVSATAFSIMGPRVLQGPHHGAQRSTITGTVALRSSTASWNVSSVTSIGQTLMGVPLQDDAPRLRSIGPGRAGREDQICVTAEYP